MPMIKAIKSENALQQKRNTLLFCKLYILPYECQCIISSLSLNVEYLSVFFTLLTLCLHLV